VTVAIVVLVVALSRLFDGRPAPLTRADVDRAVQRGIQQSQKDQRNTPPDAATAYRVILPSLVTITAEQPAAGISGVGATELGAYFSASGADQLYGVLADLPRHVQAQQRDVEVSVVFVGTAAVLVLLAVGAAVRLSTFPT
jgi:hypothetical protein